MQTWHRVALGELVSSAMGCLTFFSLAGCGQGDANVVAITDRRVMMDTVVSISVYAASDASSAAIRDDIARAFAAIGRVDSLMSSFRDDSEVADINRRAATEYVAISAATDSVLQTARWAAHVSGGAFDVTIAPVLQLWGFGTESVGLPDHERLMERLRRVDFRKLEKNNGRLRFLQPGMAIDLGGVAKGVAVDVASELLMNAGYHDLMITAGGDLRTLSSSLTSSRRHIWIQHPRAADKFFAKFLFDNGAVSTSGDYERFFERDGVRYHHVLDPQTGYPARRAVSATVLANDSRTADALSTALLVLGAERGIALADSLAGIEAVMLSITGDKLLWRASRGLADRLEIINDAAHP